MDANSEKKVIAKGFIIIRKDDLPSPRIKYKDKGHTEWNTLEKFDTKTARDKRFLELMKEKHIINN